MSTSTPADPQQSFDPDTEAEKEAAAFLTRLAEKWWLILVLGVVSVVAGIAVLMMPLWAFRFAALIFGAWLLVSGILQLAQSFDKRLEMTGRVLAAISGVIGIILGIICFDSVEDRIYLLTLFIGIWWILRGIMQLILGASGAQGGGGWSIFVGILGILAGIVVLVWPIASMAVLTIMAGLWLIVLGIFEIIASFRIKSGAKQLSATA